MNNGMNIFQLAKIFKSKGNPEKLMQELMMSNPQVREIVGQVKNSTQGATPKNIALQLAKQQGISEEDIMEVFSMLNGG